MRTTWHTGDETGIAYCRCLFLAFCAMVWHLYCCSLLCCILQNEYKTHTCYPPPPNPYSPVSRFLTHPC